jgi:hypothetical protein
MKLYDLVKFRQRLHDEYNVDRSVTELTQVVSQLTDLERDLAPTYAEYIQQNITAHTDLIQQIRQQHGTREQFIRELDQHIELVTYELFSGTYNDEINQGMMEHEHRMNRSASIPENAKDLLINRIRYHSDWHYAGMELGCRNGEMTSYLVTCDPLYIVDLDRRFLEKTSEQFSGLYQSRLRQYTINVVPDFSMLPQGQFGFIFSWDYFNYLALPTINVYLRGLFKLLRPGGTLMFTYNDGETPTGAAYAESRWNSYVPQSKLVAMAQEIGFEIAHTESFNSGVLNWIELRHPGELQTVKAHQALGEIRPRFV